MNQKNLIPEKYGQVICDYTLKTHDVSIIIAIS